MPGCRWLTLLTLLSTELHILAAPQVPFSYQRDHGWDIETGAKTDSTAQFIFDNVAALLQHWPNTRYRNGHSIVPGIIPTGTNLYHGRSDEHIPTVPEWVATDPEHSLLFCHPPCWHLTLQTKRPLKVLYFDGSSAAKTDSGSLDSQDILLWRRVDPEKTYSDRERIRRLCEWGKPFDLDGYMRHVSMEMDFEIMLCDFSAGLTVSAFEHLSTYDTQFHRAPLPGLPLSPAAFEVLHAGSWHNHNPGDMRMRLDLTRFVSFYDLSLAPSLTSRRCDQERHQHRLEGLSNSDVLRVIARLEDNLASRDVGSGVDWASLIQAIVDRLSDRFELLNYILHADSDSFPTPHQRGVLAQMQLRLILQPYIFNTTIPPPLRTLNHQNNNTWLEGTFRSCSQSHTSFVSDESILSSLTTSEHTILSAVLGTKREICRVLIKMWGEGVLSGVDRVLSRVPPDRDIEATLHSWSNDLTGLMKWLGWSQWLKCKPACGPEEICYLPTWPFSQPESRRRPWPGRRPSDPPPGPGKLIAGQDEYERDWDNPAPKCIRRIEPYST